MRYLNIRWHHGFVDEPVEYLHEIDEDSWERRKIMRFRDGTWQRAAVDDPATHDLIAEKPLPPLAEIAADPQFECRVIDAAEFEAVWRRLSP
jgi:hypothetical protein